MGISRARCLQLTQDFKGFIQAALPTERFAQSAMKVFFVGLDLRGATKGAFRDGCVPRHKHGVSKLTVELNIRGLLPLELGKDRHATPALTELQLDKGPSEAARLQLVRLSGKPLRFVGGACGQQYS